MVIVGFQARIRRASNAVDFLDFLNPITHEIQFREHLNTCFRILNESVRNIDPKNLEDFRPSLQNWAILVIRCFARIFASFDREKAFQVCYFLRRLCDRPEIRLENRGVLKYLEPKKFWT